MKERPMTRAFRAMLTVLVLSLAAPAAKSGEAEDIRAVIDGQLQAFQRDAWSEAFSFASPMIRRLFGTPERFAGMVRGGYPMVWRPSRVEAGELQQTPRGPVQLMVFEDASGVVHLAAYEMIRIDGVWKINGVRIRRMADASV
jgi:hypothetical protein